MSEDVNLLRLESQTPIKIYHVFFRYLDGDTFETFQLVATKRTKEAARQAAQADKFERKLEGDILEGKRPAQENTTSGFWYLIEESAI